MRKPVIPHNAMIFVGDGRKALFLRNEGDEKFANFVSEKVIVDDNPPTHEQGTDKPGRGFASAEGSRRSSMEPTDWHDLGEHRFAHRVAGLLEAAARERKPPAIIIVAPPRTLADIREALHADVREKVTLEVHKDLTRHPVWEIEKHVVAELDHA